MIYKIKELRKEKHMTQEELSAKSRVARGIIVRLESGKEFDTNVTTLEKIACALECQISDIFLP